MFIELEDIQFLRSRTAGVRPDWLRGGQPFVNFPDEIWMIGDGVTSVAGLPEYPLKAGVVGPLLAALAGLITANDKGLYFTGPDAPALYDLTAFARTLLDDADAATVRATLGLGALALLASPLPVTNGGTGVTTLAALKTALAIAAADITNATTVGRAVLVAASTAAGRTALAAAGSGVNADITQLIGLTTPLSAAQGGTGNDGGTWTTYAPTITAQSGTITTVGAVTGRYRQIGKTVHVSLTIPITTNGTGAVSVAATLPVSPAASFDYAMAGHARAVSGKMLKAFILPSSPTFLLIRNYDDTYPASNGEILAVSGFYEAA